MKTMTPKDVFKIITENDILVNIGGHFFEGQTKHDYKAQGLPQMSDLIPFEELGIITRMVDFGPIGKRYVRAFKSNVKSRNMD